MTNLVTKQTVIPMMYGLAIIAVLATVYFMFFSDTKTEKKKKKIVEDEENKGIEDNVKMKEEGTFDPLRWLKAGYNNKKVVTKYHDYATRLHEADGIFNDDEPAVYGVFQMLPTRMSVSMLAYVFEKDYETSLGGFLESFLDSEELGKITRIIMQKPIK